jgi:hypothetical protein
VEVVIRVATPEEPDAAEEASTKALLQLYCHATLLQGDFSSFAVGNLPSQGERRRYHELY